MKNSFFKGHGLGNDYLAMDPKELKFALMPAKIRAICDRHRGVDSDGILTLEPSSKADFGLRLYNPARTRLGSGATCPNCVRWLAASAALMRRGKSYEKDRLALQLGSRS